MENQILIPTVALYKKDIETSWRLAQSLKSAGYEPGLMLVIIKGKSGLLGENAETQVNNLSSLKESYGSGSVVVMLANMPIEEMDFFHNGENALEHVKSGIVFAKNLPLGERRIVTFHLNTLLSPEELENVSAESAKQTFDTKIAPLLKEAVSFARTHGVELKIETVPSPEFGDIGIEDERTYRGAKLRTLQNPFLISKNAPVCSFERLRSLGFGICLDLCHHRTLPVDILEEVSNLTTSDIVHLNDGAGKFGEAGETFKEGVPLGDGEIESLPEIIKTLNDKHIPLVLEVNETDFAARPNTLRSIDYLHKLQ